MARPTRLNADYFYHPADLRNDRRVGAIRTRLGLAGYGLLLMLLEVLTDADHNRLDTDEVELELLAGDLHIETKQLTELIALAERVRFFARTAENLLHCPALDEWLAPVYEKRDKVKLAQQQRRGGPSGPSSGNNRQPAETTPIVSETMPFVSETTLPVEYSREQYSREDSIESSSEQLSPEQGASELEKKRDSLGPLPTQTLAPTPPVAAPPLAPEPRRFDTWRDYDGPWHPQLHPPFETPAFRVAWAKWGKYLAEIDKGHAGPTREDEDLLRMRQLAGTDHELALHIISTSISCGWKSLNKPTHELNRRANRTGHLVADPTERHNIPAQHDFAQDAA